MKVLIITTALVAALISNSVSARSETIKCDTGFFSSDTFTIVWDDAVTKEFNHKERNCIGSAMVRVRSVSQIARLFSNGKLLDTHTNYEREPFPTCFTTWTEVSFYWQEKDMRYKLGDSHKGWIYSIKEKDWSSSEGDHWDEVLEKTYCK